MKKCIYFLFVISLLGFHARAQHPGFSRLYGYGGDTLNKAEGVATFLYDSSNASFYLGSSIWYVNTGEKAMALYKTNERGDLEKEVLDLNPNGSIYYHSVTESRDGSYLYWGGNCYTSGDGQSYWVLHKTTKDLETVWKRTYPMGAYDGYTLEAITDLDDEGVTLLCTKYSPYPNGMGLPRLYNRIYIRKVDSSGNLLSEHSPGASFSAHTNAASLVRCEDGGYMVVGRTFAWNQRDGSAFALKADEIGDEEWHKFYAQDALTCYVQGLTKTHDAEENFVMVGDVVFPPNRRVKGFVNKIDRDGNEIWRKDLAKNDSDLYQSLTAANNAQNNKIIIAGSSEQPQIVSPRGWMVLLDAEGNEVWNRIVTAFPENRYHEYLYQVVALPDGGFAAAGSSFGKDMDGIWRQKGWLVRVDSNGCMDPSCSGDIVAIDGPQLKKETVLTVYPNPASDHIYIEGQAPFPVNSKARLVDALGRTVKELPSPAGMSKMRYDLKGIAPGNYYLQLVANDNVTAIKVIIAE